MRKTYSAVAAGLLSLGLALGGGATAAQADAALSAGPSWPDSNSAGPRPPAGYALEKTYASLAFSQQCENEGAEGVRTGQWSDYICDPQARIINPMLPIMFVVQLYVRR